MSSEKKYNTNTEINKVTGSGCGISEGVKRLRWKMVGVTSSLFSLRTVN